MHFKILIMKKIFYSIIFASALVFSASTSKAQTFELEGDTVTVTAYGYVDVYNNITNKTGSPISISWKVIDHNLPQDWMDNAAFGLCDNIQCYDKSILSGSTQTTNPIDGSAQSLFKLQVNVSSSSVSPAVNTPIYLSAELTHNTTVDTAIFEVYKWATGISSTNNIKENVKLFPNPARNELNLVYASDLKVQRVAIYSLVGKQLLNIKVKNTSAKIDIDKIPSGIYFARLIDDSGQVVATRRFTHQ